MNPMRELLRVVILGALERAGELVGIGNIEKAKFLLELALFHAPEEELREHLTGVARERAEAVALAAEEAKFGG